MTEQSDPAHRRINEAGDSVPSSQESVTRAVQNLRIWDQRLPWPYQPQCPQREISGHSHGRNNTREYLRCAQCGSDPAAHVASSDHGLVRHMGQKHGRQRLLYGSIGQLRHFDRVACVVCGAVRSRRCHSCSFCNSNTSRRELRVGDTFQDRRRPGHQEVARGGTSIDQQLSQSSQPVPPGEPLDDTQLLSELRLVSAMALPRCVVSRYAMAWAESLEGAMSGHQSWALLCRYRCCLLLAEIPRGVDRNSELKQRVQLCESGQINALIGVV